jgi:hypothetical protein
VSIAVEWVAKNVVKDLVKDLEFLLKFVGVVFKLEFLQAIVAPVVGNIVLFNVSLKVILLIVHSAIFGVE